MAHPVRPDEVIEINNFYTATVYEKGAEVVRMYHTLLGADGFRRGMDLYIARHDGEAATCEDFAAAMAEAGGRDLNQFLRWYSQAGTPELEVASEYDPAARTYTLRMRQRCPATPDQEHKEPFVIPVAVGLLDRSGAELPLRLSGRPEAGGTTCVLELDTAEQSFVFEDVVAEPVPSLLRGYSAPVKLQWAGSDEDLALLMACDTDAFQRWDAGQQLALRVLLAQVESGGESPVPESFVAGLRAILADDRLDGPARGCGAAHAERVLRR